MNSSVTKTLLPEVLNLVGASTCLPDAFNIGRVPSQEADVTFDISNFKPGGMLSVDSRRFGFVELTGGSFRRIVARNVFQQLSDFDAAIEACLYLLQDGGTLEVTVPYDLSLEAWGDPSNRRAFNELTFQMLCARMAEDMDAESRFELAALNFIPSAFGVELSKTGMAAEQVARHPRAIAGLSAVLQKVSTSEELDSEPEQAPAAPVQPNPVAAPVAAHPAQPIRDLRPFAGGWENHKDKHCIWVVSPPGYVHSQAFAEVAFTLQCAFEEMGGSAPVVTSMEEFNGRIPIVFGATLLPAEVARLLPAESVIVNLEQVLPGSEWMNNLYISIMQAFPTVDYSERNRKEIARRGLDHVRTLEIGYSDRLTRIEHAPVKDIDVLFYGSMTQRRGELLDAMRAQGLNVVHLFGIYGEERDAAIGRSKVVLNVQHCENGVFEIVRVSYLLANRICVLTEGRPGDPEIAPYRGGLEVAAYDELVSRCVELVADEERRQKLAEEGFRLMSSRPQSMFLRSLIDSMAYAN
ncbi:glycosyltransferase [Rhizobium sp. NTR19]|uniref:Glycosyltransferase n=1 Tax=Neorhizobium turbinariae TaxID=2937795 RepID=A0ABT0IQH3_9HYPH|nr:glycosyltransferase [Neorhizobium turbinariae]MCK8780137.1 glycosyltransferase [Neorhizobium turbinariae]